MMLNSPITVLWCFCRISVISKLLFLGIGLKTKSRKPRKIFWIYQMHVHLFFNHYFNFLSVQTKVNRNNRLNLTNLERSASLERQKYGTWLAWLLNHFENDVIWTIFEEFLKLHSHMSVFWFLWWISVISEFSFLDIGLKRKPGNHGKSLFLGL